MLTKELEIVNVLTHTHTHTQVESSNKLDLVNIPKNISYELAM